MNTNNKNEIGPRRKFQHLLVAGVAALWLLLPFAAGGAGVVANCTEAELRAAMAGGGTITFECDGTIALADTITNVTDTVLDATGRQIVISGNNAVRVFYNNPTATLTLINVSVANGRICGVRDPVFWWAWPAEAGGVLNLGKLNAINCTFRENRAEGTNGFYYSSPNPGDGAAGGSANGGAVMNGNGATFNATRCSFMLNRAVGGYTTNAYAGSANWSPGDGRRGGSAAGGAIYNLGTMTLESSLFASNGVAGGTGGQGGEGADFLTTISFPPQKGGLGGRGGEIAGAAIFNVSTAVVINCTFAWNLGVAGGGGAGGRGGHVSRYPHYEYDYPGGNGGSGGPAYGAISDADGFTRSLRMTNCTVALNFVPGGAGGLGGQGSGAQPDGSPGSNGSASGVVNLNGASLINVLLATNTPGGNCSGTFTDGGHNLSSDASATFTNVGSMTNTDPKLGPLADNGGPTLTMALQPGSPAIDAGDSAAAPTTDQRGHPRPVGPAADIGAYEYGTTPRLRIGTSQTGSVEILLYDASGPTVRLLKSSTLTGWQCVATNQVNSDGTTVFQDDCTSDESRFYKTLSP